MNDARDPKYWQPRRQRRTRHCRIEAGYGADGALHLTVWAARWGSPAELRARLDGAPTPAQCAALVAACAPSMRADVAQFLSDYAEDLAYLRTWRAA